MITHLRCEMLFRAQTHKHNPTTLSGEYILRGVKMAIDDLLDSAVRIRRGRHGGRTGKVVVSDRRTGSYSSYSVIKVQLDASGEIVDINSLEQLEKLPILPGEHSV